MSGFSIAVVSFLTGVLASMGMGGGMLLIIYLTIFAGVGQLQAQGINLVFFLPIAAASLVFHVKNKLLDYKKALPAMLTGIAASAAFSLLAAYIKTEYLEKAFGLFIAFVGVVGLCSDIFKCFHKNCDTNNDNV